MITDVEIQSLKSIAKQKLDSLDIKSPALWFKELGVISAYIQEANGFDAATNETLLAKLMLVITEIDEAIDGIEDVENPIAEEVADIAIRLLAIAENFSDGDWHYRSIPKVEPLNIFSGQTPEELLFPIISMCSKAAEAHRKGKKDDTINYIELAIKETYLFAVKARIDLFKEVIKKSYKNLNRGWLHGKQVSS